MEARCATRPVPQTGGAFAPPPPEGAGGQKQKCNNHDDDDAPRAPAENRSGRV